MRAVESSQVSDAWFGVVETVEMRMKKTRRLSGLIRRFSRVRWRGGDAGVIADRSERPFFRRVRHTRSSAE